MAQVLKQNTDYNTYLKYYTNLCLEFHSAFYDPQAKGYGSNNQTANTMALYLDDVIPADLKSVVATTLIDDITQKRNTHLTTGIIGTRFILPVLSNYGRTDLAMALATQTTYPSWGYMFNNPYENATTMWERWDTVFENGEMNNRNQAMFCGVGVWLYKNVVGIHLNAFQPIQIEPGLVAPCPNCQGALSSANGCYQSIKGRICSNWEIIPRENGVWMNIETEIPANTNALLILNDPLPRLQNSTSRELVFPWSQHFSPFSRYRSIQESNQLVYSDSTIDSVVWTKGILDVKLTEKGAIQLSLASGMYLFSVNYGV